MIGKWINSVNNDRDDIFVKRNALKKKQPRKMYFILFCFFFFIY